MEADEAKLLQAILCGRLQLSSFTPWLLSEDDSSRLPQDAAALLTQASNAKLLSITPSSLRACVLNTVREEAEALFSAAELALESGTPRQQDQAASKSRLTPDRRLSDRLSTVPGSVDEANFPTLEAASQLPGKAKSVRLAPGALMRLVTPEASSSLQQTSAASSAVSRAGGQARTRIAPTAVQAVQRDARFVAGPQQHSRPAGQRRKIAPTPISATSRDASVTQSWDPTRAATLSGGNLSAASSVSTSAWGPRQPGPFTSGARPRHEDAERPQISESGGEPSAGHRPEAAQRWGNRSDALLNGLRAESESPSSHMGSTGKADLRGRSPSPTTAWEKQLMGAPPSSPAPADSARSSPSLTVPSGATPRSLPVGGAKLPRSQGSAPSQESGRKPPRSLSPNPALSAGKGDARSTSWGRRDSPGTTPQSRFRPLQAVDKRPEEVRSVSPEMSAHIGGGGGTEMPCAEHSMQISFHSLRLAQADAEPCTPKLAPSRQSWAPSEPQSSPQGSVYYTGSEGEDSTPTKPLEAQFWDASDHEKGGYRTSPTSQSTPPPAVNTSICGEGEMHMESSPLGSRAAKYGSGSSIVEEQASCRKAPSTGSAGPGERAQEGVGKCAKVGHNQQAATGRASAMLSELAARVGYEGPAAEASVPVPPCSVPGEGAAIAQSSTTVPLSDSVEGAAALLSPSLPSKIPCIGERTLPEAGRKLAELHAELLASWPGVALVPELGLLLHLLTVPAEVTSLSCAVLWCGDVAASYVCAVLLAAGRLVESLGAQMLEVLHESPAVQKHSPELQMRLRQALQRQQPQAHERGPPHPGVLSLMAFTSDGLSKRTPEEQRRVSNREMCRDELLALLREASGAGQTFVRQQPHMLDGPGSEDAAFSLLQHRVPALLRRVAPENFGHLAELFAAAVLQAVATGEALLDEELSSLAQQDVSRFERLNQRMQAQPGGRPPGRLPVSPASSGPSFPAPTPAFSGPRSMGSMGRALPPGKWATARSSQEGLDRARTLAAEFVPALRLYVLFLEAGDSHRLNVQLIRCMVGKLRLLADESNTLMESPASSQQVAAMAALASFLSYLSFAAATAATAAPTWGSSDTVPHSAPTAAGLSRLLRTSLWVARYLWFLPWDPGSAASPYFTAVLRALSGLQRTPRLRPGSASFGTAELCLRSVLDGLLGRCGANLRPGPTELDLSAHLSDTEDGGIVDVRLMQLSCPLLEQSQRTIQASTAGRRGPARPGGVRKITPSVPSAPTLGPQVPDSVAAAAAGCTDPAQLSLQRAFLDMYSTAEHKVSLRDIVTRTADIVGHNASVASMDACVPKSVEHIAAELAAKADALVHGRKAPLQAEALHVLLMPLAEQLISQAVWQALGDCQERAHKRAERKVVAALTALAHPDCTEAIVGTAAAIAAQSAQAVCAKRLITEVPVRVRALVTAHVKVAVSKACKKQAQAQASGGQAQAQTPGTEAVLSDRQDSAFSAEISR